MNKERLQIAINLMYIFTDIADGYATEVENQLKANGLYNRNDKQRVKKIKDLTGELVNSIDRILDAKTIDDFVNDSEFLQQVVELMTKVESEEQKKEIIKLIKSNVKV